MQRETEIANNSDKFYDFCFREYFPKGDLDGRLRSSELLFTTFDICNCPTEFFSLVKKIRLEIGINRTVWGAKLKNNELSWEYYFYNFEKNNPRISVPDILNILTPFYRSQLCINPKLPYFMFSFDITKLNMQRGKLSSIHIYIMEPIDGLGRSYRIEKNGTKMENYYIFFDKLSQKPEILRKLKQSAFIDLNEHCLDDILIPQLSDCRSVCVANKSTCDGIYFVGINISQFIWFLKTFKYPRQLINFVNHNKHRLDYLNFDVGFDFIMKRRRINI